MGLQENTRGRLSKYFGRAKREHDDEVMKRYKKLKEAKKKAFFMKWMNKTTFVFFDLFKWKVYDIVQSLKDKEKLPHYYGIRMFCGLYGQGKTMSMIEYLDRVRKKHGDKVIIITNFYYVHEDFHLESWKQMLDKYDRTVIFAIDEVQNEFNSRDYRNFPHGLITLLTQNRKGHGIQVISSAQRYDHVDKVFRDLCEYIYECKTICGRLTMTKRYAWHDYQQLNGMVSVDKKMKVPKDTHFYVQTNYMRGLYDSFKMIESAKERLVKAESETEGNGKVAKKVKT